jgi:NADH-quinone oxidoreductase subunit M
MPMWPVHTWLPDAHVEAPTAGSVILAAILLKMGGYGFLRFSLPMFPAASHDFAPLVFALSIVAIIYTSLVALVQEDMKKLIAYSSVAHMGFVTMGIFAATTQGVAGGIFQMISHGVVSGALFLCVGVIYAVATFATIGTILSAAYALWLYRKVIYGVLDKPALAAITDLDYREIITLGPLAVLAILLGIFPQPVLDLSAASVAQLLDSYTHALDTAHHAALLLR